MAFDSHANAVVGPGNAPDGSSSDLRSGKTSYRWAVTGSIGHNAGRPAHRTASPSRGAAQGVECRSLSLQKPLIAHQLGQLLGRDLTSSGGKVRTSGISSRVQDKQISKVMFPGVCMAYIPTVLCSHVFRRRPVIEVMPQGICRSGQAQRCF